MFNIDDRFIDHSSHAIIMTDSRGVIIKKNNAADLLIRQCLPDSEMPKTIFQIDAAFDLKIISPVQEKYMQIGDSKKTVNVFLIRHRKHGEGLLFMFETSPLFKSMNFTSFLDYIDDAIFITNKDHVAEEVNQAFQRLTGLETKNIKGRVLEDLINKDFVVKDSVCLKVFRHKSFQELKLQYITGKTLIWSAWPVYNGDGEVEWVIATGRDVSELVELEAKLFKTEKLKSKYYEKLKKLESSLGKADIIYSSNEMKAVVDVAMKAARSDSPVFIWGESGVGKELIANLVHKTSPRKNMPFIAINCAAIPSELLESELFGYTEGAFTGAQKGGKKGLFQEADGGTIFLDEIGEMPVLMQSKLLRVLQTNELMNIGGNKKISINTRVISSTNLPKDKLANDVHFRQDLYYRLTVIPVYVPALRERRDDIPALVEHFLKAFNMKYKANRKFSGGLLRRLYNYEWPGNVRELKNVIERLIIFSESDEIREDEIYALNLENKKEADVKNGDILLKGVMPMKTAVRKFQEILVQRALEQCGSIIKAAKMLEINPATVHRIKKNISGH
jgi:PAS domain S-box-containing protein